ncbi:MAG: flavoprotein [Phycisphaerae bacterium]
MESTEPAAGDLVGYEVGVGVCGGISAYKTCELVSQLVQRGAGVTVAMTESACRFVGPVTFEALSARKVLTSLWYDGDATDVRHVALSELVDLFVVAPATANMLGKLAAGIADDLLSTLLIARDSPLLMAPAMNPRMWANPIVGRNVRTLTELGVHVVGPCEGWLACRDSGTGRMAEPDAILDAAVGLLKRQAPKNRA